MITRTAVAIGCFALATGFLAGCGSAPNEQATNADEGLCYNCDPYPDPTPTSPPPPTCTSFDGATWALSVFPYTSGGGYMDPGGVLYGRLPQPANGSLYPVWPNPGSSPYHVFQTRLPRNSSGQYCISATDTLRNAQRYLVNAYGCSAPVFFWAHNSSFGPSSCAEGTGATAWSCWEDKANGWAQLCPTSVTTYVNSLGYQYYDDGLGYRRSDIAAHMWNPYGSFYGDALPSAPSGWGWAITWEDPTGCSGGCMCAI